MLLSICIPTLNRGDFIGETLDSILAQMRDDVEVVIVDGGSRDRTAEVVAERTARCPRVRHHLTPHLAAGVPKPSNAGYDRDCDHALQLAQGRYCWILPDDDLVVPGGLARLVRHLEAGVALVVANAEVRSNDLQRVLEPRRMAITGDETFARGEADRLVIRAGAYLSYAGGVVVRRDWWLRRDRARYYGSGFVHMGALLQDPSDLDAVVLAEPLIWLRYGNALWTARAFEIWMFQWPDLIWSFPLSDQAKAAVTPHEPWRRLRTLMLYRARGCYGRSELQRLKAHAAQRSVPGPGFAATCLTWVPACLMHALITPVMLLRCGARSTVFLDLWLSPTNLWRRLFSRPARPAASSTNG
jgi:abequosyltransferase